jgi:predicted GNAT family acetyltransferase
MTTPEPTESRFADNETEHRYELWVGDQRVGTISYRSRPNAIVLVRTVVDSPFEGKGYGSRLVHDALADIRARGLKVVAHCDFVSSYLRRHPDEADVLPQDRPVEDR